MAKLILVFSLTVLFLAAFNAQANQPSQRQSQCRIQNIDAIQPTRTVNSEAGVTEHWDQNNEQLECAGVTVIRYTIQPKGLHLPHYHNAPEVSYVVQGRGLHGVAIPGCPESYQSFQQSQHQRQQQSPYDQPGQQWSPYDQPGQQQSPYDQPGQQQQQESPFERGQQQQGSRQGDRHQKIRSIGRGDILVTPVGVPKWIYNDGNIPLVIVTLLDIGNNENQLDNNRRTFYLAGNPQAQGQQGQQGQQQGQQRGWQRGQQQGDQQGQQETSSYNIFRHMDDQRLAEVFNARQETVSKLKGQNDNRGNIIRVENELQVVRPPRMQQEEQQEQQGGRPNGLEESSCNLRLRVNIDNPRHSYVYNPEAGRINRINGRDLPILRLYNLNAERGVLRQNAHRAPHWNMNAHSVLYCTSGSARVQIVGNYQQPIYDGEFRQGQVLVVPQNFAVMKQAGKEGLEWIAFKTNDPAMTSPLAGRDSIMRAFPEDVLRNAFQMSSQEVRNIKYNRDETEIFPSTSEFQQRAIA